MLPRPQPCWPGPGAGGAVQGAGTAWLEWGWVAGAADLALNLRPTSSQLGQVAPTLGTSAVLCVQWGDAGRPTGWREPGGLSGSICISPCCPARSSSGL